MIKDALYDEVCQVLASISEVSFNLLHYHSSNNNESFLEKKKQELLDMQIQLHSFMIKSREAGHD